LSFFQAFTGTPFSVSKIGLGFGLGGIFDRTAQIQPFEMAMRRGLELGINLIDTAENYASGQSEELLGAVLRNHELPHLLATKVAPNNFAEPRFCDAVSTSLRRLKRDQIDLLYLHWPNPAVPRDSLVESLTREIKSGRVAGVGLSNFSISEIEYFMAALPKGTLWAIQHEYNLFDRSAEDNYIPFSKKHGLSFVGYSPLDQGQIIGGGWRLNRLVQLAKDENITVNQLALKWLQIKSEVFLIPSTSKVARVEEYTKLEEIEPRPETLAEIERLSASVQKLLPLSKIEVLTDPTNRRKVYVSIEEAKENLAEFSPSPLELAQDLIDGAQLKPIRVRVVKSGSEEKFVLEEGRIRYWAHMIAFGPTHKVQVLLRS
jgi:aryl-alcohol dehydrogenase-like predicted oxidoreductase